MTGRGEEGPGTRGIAGVVEVTGVASIGREYPRVFGFGLILDQGEK